MFCKPLVSVVKDGSVFLLCALHRVALQLGRIYTPIRFKKIVTSAPQPAAALCCSGHMSLRGFGGGAQLYAAEPLLVHSAEPGRPRPLPVLPLLRYERGCQPLGVLKHDVHCTCHSLPLSCPSFNSFALRLR